MQRVIAVDLDGCLAEYFGWNNGIIGKPVAVMVNHVKEWLAEGHEVIIFTERVCFDESLYSKESDKHADAEFVAEQKELIQAWCQEHIGVVLPVTAQKDFRMTDFYDDRAWRVEKNTGRICE